MRLPEISPSPIWKSLTARMVLAPVLATCFFGSGCQTASRSALAADTNTAAVAPLPVVETTKVVSRHLQADMSLPGELRPYKFVDIYPKVTGFVEWIGVDRGSRVKQGQLLVRLVAPELVSQKAQAQAELASAEQKEVAEQAKLTADQSTYERLKQAAATPGVISDEELEVAQKAAESDHATVVALHSGTEAAMHALQSVETLEGYLHVTAPFDGMITTRYVHPGALVGPTSGRSGSNAGPILRLEEVAHLRLVVPVPEAYVAGAAVGQDVKFTVEAFPGQTFSGKVARLSDSLNPQTRTMPVELDIWNPDWTLHSGMFPQVSWPVRRPYPTLFVPTSSVARTMESTFVVRVRNGVTEWVNVTTGVVSGSLTEVFGDLHAGDDVVLNASGELRPNTHVSVRAADQSMVAAHDGVS